MFFKNELSENEVKRLSKLIEECSEVIQAACKVIRFGYESTPPNSERTNRFSLECELADLEHAVQHLKYRDEVSTETIEALVEGKIDEIPLHEEF